MGGSGWTPDSGEGRSREIDDPFSVLGLPREYGIRESDIADARRRWLMELHPDRWSDPLIQEQATRRSALVNAAATRLLDPETRAEAILDLLDPGAPAMALSATQLLELLEWREAADVVRTDPTATAAMRARIDEARESSRGEIAAAFARPVPELRAVRAALSWLRALSRLEEAVTSARHAAGSAK